MQYVEASQKALELQSVPERTELEALLESRPEVYAFLRTDSVYRAESIDSLNAQLRLNYEFDGTDNESLKDLIIVREMVTSLGFDPDRSIQEQVQEQRLVESTPPYHSELTQLGECFTRIEMESIDGDYYQIVSYDSDSWATVHPPEKAEDPDFYRRLKRYLQLRYWVDAKYARQTKTAMKYIKPTEVTQIAAAVYGGNQEILEDRRRIATESGIDRFYAPGSIVGEFAPGWCSNGKTLKRLGAKFAKATGGVAILQDNEGMMGNELDVRTKKRLGLETGISRVESYATQIVIEREREGFLGNPLRNGKEPIRLFGVGWSKGAMAEKKASADQIRRIALHLGKTFDPSMPLEQQALTLGDIYFHISDIRSLMLATAEADSTYFVEPLKDATVRSWLYSMVSGNTINLGLFLSKLEEQVKLLQNPLATRSLEEIIKFYADSVLSAKGWVGRLKNPFGSAFDQKVQPSVEEISSICASLFMPYADTVLNSKKGLIEFDGLSAEDQFYLSFAWYINVIGTGDLLTEAGVQLRQQERDDNYRRGVDNPRTLTLVKRAGHAVQTTILDMPFDAIMHLDSMQLRGIADFARAASLCFTQDALTEEEKTFLHQQQKIEVDARSNGALLRRTSSSYSRVLDTQGDEFVVSLLSSLPSLRAMIQSHPETREELLGSIIGAASSKIGALNGSRKAVDTFIRYFANERIAPRNLQV